MAYALGVDLGTTYTAAGTFRDGRVEIATLGNRSAAIPSVVLLKDDEEILTGEAASRRGASEPGRVAREFKRRVGDTTPIFLGGAPYSAEQLMARLLDWVAAEVAAREGGPADNVAISHPANWGPYKKDLLAQAVRLAGLPAATFLTEPEAAAMHYASQQRVEPGEIVAVYDLGGGTFDVAVLRNTADGFEILGEPEGVERLGGIDFDAAVFAHVARSLGSEFEDLDEDDPAAVAAVGRLRQECVEAKEALSTDTDVSIPVMLPNLSTEVRLTRSEFEAMVRPALGDSIAALRRALQSAEIEPGDVSTVLLVGGSSRIPLVSQLVGAELGRPVAIDIHPKNAIALGAARAAAQTGDMPGAAGLAGEPARGDDGDKGAAAGRGAGAAGIAAAGGAAAGAAAATLASGAGGDAPTSPAGSPSGGPPTDPTSSQAGGPASGSATPPSAQPSGPPADASAADAVDAAARGAGSGAAGAAAAAAAAGSADDPTVVSRSGSPTDPTLAQPAPPPPPPGGAAGAAAVGAAGAGATTPYPQAGDAGPGGASEDTESKGGPPGWVIAVGALLIVLLLAGGAFALVGGDDGGKDEPGTTSSTTTTESTTTTVVSGGAPIFDGGTDDGTTATTTAPPTTPPTTTAPTTTTPAPTTTTP